MAAFLLIIHALHIFATLAMTGLIWFVQIVHYPMMSMIPADAFRAYEQEHMRRTTRVVGPLMLIELASAIALAAMALTNDGSTADEQALAAIGLALLATIWISTAALQVPCHRRLCDGRCEATIARLVRTNWLRTTAWTLRSGIAIAMLLIALRRLSG